MYSICENMIFFFNNSLEKSYATPKFVLLFGTYKYTKLNFQNISKLFFFLWNRSISMEEALIHSI
jgi:hypothetical protein